MIDSCEPIPFFPNLITFLDKKGPVAEMEIYSDIAFLFLLYTEKEDEEENTCMWGFNTALKGWVSCSWVAREKAVM